MNRSFVLLVSAAALFSAPAYAADALRPAPTSDSPSTARISAPAEAGHSQVAQSDASQSGPAAAAQSEQCSRENPFIEYRDCVNASTRDKNAKVRLG